MPGRLEFFYDYGSPYSYLADTRLEALQQRTSCELVYRPMLLGGVFKATGNQSPAQQPVEAKRKYGGAEMRRWVEYLGVEWQGNPFFPINTLPLMRVAYAAQRADVFAPFHRAVYPAFWVHGKNLGDPEVFAEVLQIPGDTAPVSHSSPHRGLEMPDRELTMMGRRSAVMPPRRGV